MKIQLKVNPNFESDFNKTFPNTHGQITITGSKGKVRISSNGEMEIYDHWKNENSPFITNHDFSSLLVFAVMNGENINNNFIPLLDSCDDHSENYERRVAGIVNKYKKSDYRKEYLQLFSSVEDSVAILQSAINESSINMHKPTPVQNTMHNNTVARRPLSEIQREIREKELAQQTQHPAETIVRESIADTIPETVEKLPIEHPLSLMENHFESSKMNDDDYTTIEQELPDIGDEEYEDVTPFLAETARVEVKLNEALEEMKSEAPVQRVELVPIQVKDSEEQPMEVIREIPPTIMVTKRFYSDVLYEIKMRFRREIRNCLENNLNFCYQTEEKLMCLTRQPIEIIQGIQLPTLYRFVIYDYTDKDFKIMVCREENLEQEVNSFIDEFEAIEMTALSKRYIEENKNKEG